MNVIEVNNLEKRYDEKTVVKNLSFSVKEGEVLGLLGPNGAGKSTTINMLSSILKNDSGSINVLGKDLEKNKKFVKKSIGVVPQDLAIYEEISAKENVTFFASLYGLRGKELVQEVENSLRIVGLLERQNDKPKTFSGGMKRRLNIACAITHRPQLLIMDEPTVGIDPQSRNHILKTIQKLRDNGTSIIYSTHYMEEVEAIAEGTKEELYQKMNTDVAVNFELKFVERLNQNNLVKLPEVNKYKLQGNMLKIYQSEKGDSSLNRLITTILRNGCQIETMSTKKTTLENLFLDLTGRKLKD
jgi:ABC-2 type transport system ATP-binding protein